MAVTGQTIATDALIELGVIGVGTEIPAASAVYVTSKLARLIDNFNAEEEAIFNVQFLTFPLIPSNGAPTLGPTGDWTVSQRPNRIIGANVILNNVSPNVRAPVNIRDDQWWLLNPVRGINSTFPTDLFYSPEWPNGVVNLWPVPSTSYDFEIEVPLVLAEITLNSTFSMPPGYRDAITLTLAEDLQGAYLGSTTLPMLSKKALEARARIFSNNYDAPRLTTRDTGIPTTRSTNETTYNYRTGLYQP